MTRIIDKIHERRKEYARERSEWKKNMRKRRRATGSNNCCCNSTTGDDNNDDDIHKSTNQNGESTTIINNNESKSVTNSNIIHTNSTVHDINNNTTSSLTTPIIPGWHHSFEYFPPKTERGLDNLLVRIDRMTRAHDPLFVDVTWGSGHTTAIRSLSIAAHSQRYAGVDVLLHLSCAGEDCTREMLVGALSRAWDCGVRNVLCLRGDVPRERLVKNNKNSNSKNNKNKNNGKWNVGSVGGGYCDRAIDLVKLVKNIYGDRFGVAVAGHPEGHPATPEHNDNNGSNDNNNNLELYHLLEKVQAGADFILTQFFYNVDLFLQYVHNCRKVGITCPIVPGIMPIQSYQTFVRMTQCCDVSVPEGVMELLRPAKDDDEAVKIIGCRIAEDACRRILGYGSHNDGNYSSAEDDDDDDNDGDDDTTTVDIDANGHVDVDVDINSKSNKKEWNVIDGVHFYTLNLERSVTRILCEMGTVATLLRNPTVTHQRHFDAPLPSNGTNDDVNKYNSHDSRRTILPAPPSLSSSSLSSSPSSLSSDLKIVPKSSSSTVAMLTTPSTAGRKFPWRRSAMDGRRDVEEVRPVHWANRPYSYVMRTEYWDEFPNGRWGDSSSPAFGELSDMVSHLFSNYSQVGLTTMSSSNKKHDGFAILVDGGNNVKCKSDIHETFARYVEGRLPYLPWCDGSSSVAAITTTTTTTTTATTTTHNESGKKGSSSSVSTPPVVITNNTNPITTTTNTTTTASTTLAPESHSIRGKLAAMCRAGLMTVNSQPAVDGLPSDHPVHGWGGKGGRIYQRAYCEFFASPRDTERIAWAISKCDGLNLYAIGARGGELLRAKGGSYGCFRGVDNDVDGDGDGNTSATATTTKAGRGTTALTWGIFPDQEVLQPTVFDPSTFLVWAEEAFALWDAGWADLYEEGSSGKDVVRSMRDECYLVAVVDNNFFDTGTISSPLLPSSGGRLWDILLKAVDTGNSEG